MKKQLLLILFALVTIFTYAQEQTVTYSVDPSTFNEDESITITFNGSSINEALWGVTDNALYLWSWSFDVNDSPGSEQDAPTNGSWTNSNEANRLTYNAGPDTYSITFVPTAFYNRTGIGRIGFLIKALDGTGDKKSQDILVEVGKFQLTLNTPADETIFVNQGSSVNITATASLPADFTLKENGATIDTQNDITNYTFSRTVNATASYVLEATTDGTDTQSAGFTAIVTPTVISEAIPSGIEEGINYDANDNTKVTLALKAPFKDYVYVAGSFNDYTPNNTYLMKRDVSDTDLYWLEITGLTPNQPYTFQYWVVDETPLATSPRLVKTADPYSTLILDPNFDNSIPGNTFPNMPTYPAGQQREVTVIETGQTPYNWVVDNFEKPKKEDLIIYEVLVRDFDSDRNFQDLIDKIDYFKDLNINAIHLMPLNEFPGNLSWGYNPSFHMALDKAYGTKDKLKEFIDLCHQNGIAVILDIVLNHAFQESPLVRMWAKNVGSNGLGPGSSENPYVNEIARHPFNVGEDMNHESALTKNYVRRNIKYWIEEFKFDGFRWDLSKGFTQNNTGSDVGAWNAYDQSRIDILQEYADYSWSLDETHYVIFEHLGIDAEESVMANYRLGDQVSKGIMFWGKMTDEYNEFTMGFNSDISRADHRTRGFNAPRLIMYPESHDEERIMYKNITFGDNSNANHNVRSLPIALKRMETMAAVSYTIPGPKMIWHFSDLGMDVSLFTCGDGVTVSPGDDGCKLDTKPQPQWANNWLNDPDRRKVYDTWSRLFDLKINEDVFEGDFALEGTTRSVRLYIFDDNIDPSELKNVVILANFRNLDQNIVPDFPYTGTWYDLMDDTPYNVNSTSNPILIPAGEFRIFGNQPSTLSNEEQIINDPSFVLYPNPSNGELLLNKRTSRVTLYNLLGKEVSRFDGDFDEHHSFDVSSLRSGMYVMKAQTENGQVIRKFIKN